MIKGSAEDLLKVCYSCCVGVC